MNIPTIVLMVISIAGGAWLLREYLIDLIFVQLFSMFGFAPPEWRYYAYGLIVAIVINWLLVILGGWRSVYARLNRPSPDDTPNQVFAAAALAKRRELTLLAFLFLIALAVIWQISNAAIRPLLGDLPAGVRQLIDRFIDRPQSNPATSNPSEPSTTTSNAISPTQWPMYDVLITVEVTATPTLQAIDTSTPTPPVSAPPESTPQP